MRALFAFLLVAVAFSWTAPRVRAVDMPSPALDIEALRGTMTDYVSDTGFEESDVKTSELFAIMNVIASGADSATKRDNKWFEVHFLVQHLSRSDVSSMWNALGLKHMQYVDMVTETIFGDLHVVFAYMREESPIKCKNKVYSVSWKTESSSKVKSDGSVIAETNLVCDGYITQGSFIDLVSSKVFRDGDKSKEVTFKDVTPAAKRQNSQIVS